jgi:hypothetical protein
MRTSEFMKKKRVEGYDLTPLSIAADNPGRRSGDT